MHWLSRLHMILESVQDRVFEPRKRPKKKQEKESGQKNLGKGQKKNKKRNPAKRAIVPQEYVWANRRRRPNFGCNLVWLSQARLDSAATTQLKGDQSHHKSSLKKPGWKIRQTNIQVQRQYFLLESMNQKLRCPKTLRWKL